MPIIYSYPSKTTPTSGDLLLISDVSASNQTKKITIGDLKDPLDVVDSISATLPIQVSAPTGSVTISSRAYGGSLTTGYVPTGGSATTFLRGDGSWATPSGSGSGTGGFETLPFTTANGYLSGETSTGTYVFQMIAPSNCAPANFKFYNLLTQSTGRTTTVAIYKGIIGDEGTPGSLQSTGQITGPLGATQISGSTLTVEDAATAISAGDNIVVCFSIDEEIQPLGVVPTTASGGITLTNASPVNNSKLAIHDSGVSLTAAQIQANATTVTALEALLTSSAATTSRPFLIIY